MMAKRVFVVDDEKIIADTLAAILARCGYDVHAFYDAESALIKAEFRAPDLVISDVVTPQMNGLNMSTAQNGKTTELADWRALPPL